MKAKETNKFDIKEFLLACNINHEVYSLVIELDNNLEYKKQVLVIDDGKLYKYNENHEIIEQYDGSDIVSFSNDFLVDFGKVIINLKDKSKTLCYFSKNQSGKFDYFINNAKAILDGNKKYDEHKHFGRICPKCKKEIPQGKDFCENCYSKKGTLFRLLSYIKSYKLAFLSIIMILILSSAVGVLLPIYTRKFLYNEVLEQNGVWYGKILLFATFYLLLHILGILFDIAYGRIIAKTSAKLCFNLKNEVFASMQKLSYKFFEDKQTGSLMNRVVWDVNMVFYAIIDDVPYIAVNLMKIIGISGYLLITNYKLTLLSLVALPIALFIFVKVTPKLRNAWHQNFVRDNALSNMVSDTLEGFRVVKVFSGQQKEVNKFDNLATKNMKALNHQRLLNAIVYPSVRFIIATSSLIIWGYGGYVVIKGEMNFGDFSTFIAGIELLFTPLEWMCQILFNHSVRVLTSARRIFEIIDGIPDVNEIKNPVSLANIQGKVTFEHVSFSYEPINPVLQDVSFEIKPNSKFGIVGKTGTGKTTLMNLLSRLYDVNDGAIKIDDVNIKDLSFEFLHKNVAMISQDTYLFKGSVFDNIRYGKEDATYDEVINAARLASAHEFVVKLQDGYDTIIGEGGISLSGGERQRLSIARAILLNSKIIIFDEATSAMDSITEHKIQQAIEKLGKDKTIIMIAHRLSTLKDVDNLIVIEDHKVVESGTMDELIAKDGLFAKLIKIQQEGLQHISIGE